MRRTLRALAIGVLVAGVAVGCGNKSGDDVKPSPGSSTSQNGDSQKGGGGY